MEFLVDPYGDDGPAWEVRTAFLTARAGGVCERCGTDLGPTRSHWSIHHRLPRRMGGRTGVPIHRIANLAALCGHGTLGCHGHIESNRTDAISDGWVLHEIDDPTEVPVKHRLGWRLLDDNGLLIRPPMTMPLPRTA